MVFPPLLFVRTRAERGWDARVAAGRGALSFFMNFGRYSAQATPSLHTWYVEFRDATKQVSLSCAFRSFDENCYWPDSDFFGL